ncbi:hypothetical protein [Emticicia soli]|uniref:Uncharacterized protein n=1 Tax=Emticicia soli TaxID=2027878 RepID=A0ABW5JBY0_9BACT
MTKTINPGPHFMSSIGIDKSKVTTLFGQLKPITKESLKKSLGMENPYALIEINDSVGKAKTYFMESEALVNFTQPQADSDGKYPALYVDVFEEAQCSVKKRHDEYHKMPIKEARNFREYMPTYTPSGHEY